MTIEEKFQTASALLEPFSKGAANPQPNRLDVHLDATHLLPAVQALTDARWGYLSAITGLDLSLEGGELEVLYHFCSGPAITTLRVPLPRQDPHVPSICGPIPAATLFERETGEMFGITFDNSPNTERIFLPEDWPEGVYPLRKDFDPATSKPVPPANGGRQENTNKFVVPIGPQHPALKEPGHFEFIVDGEVVTDASIRLGYVHRGIEKGCEDRNWAQCLYLLERICGICSHVHAFGFSLSVEQLAGVEAPPRAQAIRELAAGLERIHSHLLWLGVAAHEAGFDTLFMYSWRDRETVMDLLESMTGNRVNYSVNVLGGVKCDITPELADTIRKGLEYLDTRMQHYLNVVSTDAAFLLRTRGVGTMTAEEVEMLGVVGPTARASGVKRDIRVEAPYGSYSRFPVSVVYETAGDLEAKFIVRIKEMMVSIQTMLAILDNLPGGELTVRVPRKIPAGDTITRIEAPRGELLYYVRSTGGEKPDRVHVRTPSIRNFASVMHLAVGHQLADIPLILAGIDPCFSCNDRMVMIRKQGAETEAPRILTWEAFRRLGNEKLSR